MVGNLIKMKIRIIFFFLVAPNFPFCLSFFIQDNTVHSVLQYINDDHSNMDDIILTFIIKKMNENLNHISIIDYSEIL